MPRNVLNGASNVTEQCLSIPECYLTQAVYLAPRGWSSPLVSETCLPWSIRIYRSNLYLFYCKCVFNL